MDSVVMSRPWPSQSVTKSRWHDLAARFGSTKNSKRWSGFSSCMVLHVYHLFVELACGSPLASPDLTLYF